MKGYVGIERRISLKKERRIPSWKRYSFFVLDREPTLSKKASYSFDFTLSILYNRDMFNTKIKLIATDMDGTLLDSHKRLPPTFKSWVLAHGDIKTVIASGRQYYALERDFRDIKDHLIFIAENGSLVFHKGKIIFQNVMKKEDIFRVLDLLQNVPSCMPLLCGVNSAYRLMSEDKELFQATMYYERLKQVENLYAVAEKEKIVKLAIYFREQKAEQSSIYFSSLPEHLKAVVSGVSWIDIANADANKGRALLAIMEKYGITKEESMAFGDYFNDVEMLDEVKYSIATANAHPDIKKRVSYITLSNDEQGVMKVLEKIK